MAFNMMTNINLNISSIRNYYL